MITWLKKCFAVNVSNSAATTFDENKKLPQPEAMIECNNHKASGDAFLKEGKLEEATVCYRLAIAANQLDAEAHNKLGDLFYERRALADAEACYRRAVENKTDYFDAWVNLGLSLDEQRLYTQAEACYGRALELKPDSALVHFNLGLTIKSQRRLPEAEANFRLAIKIEPSFSLAHFQLGETLRELGKNLEAESSYQRAWNIRPNFLEAWSALLTITLSRGGFIEAEMLCRNRLVSTPYDAVLNYNLGVTLKEQGRNLESEQCFRTAINLKGDFPQAFLNLGSTLLAQKRYSEAEEICRLALALQSSADVYSNLGLALMKQGRFADAEKNYRFALSENKDHLDALGNLGILCYEQGRYSEAEIFFRLVFALKPRSVSTLINLGNTHEKMNRLTQAEANYRLALEIDPNSDLAHNGLGVLLDDLGRNSEAEACYRHALKVNPDFSEAFNNLLFVLNYHPDMSGEDIYAEYKEYDRRFAQVHRNQWREFANERIAQRRLKIAYLSPDFRTHPVRHFLEPLLAHHNKKDLEVYAYAELRYEDTVTLRFKSYVDHWIPTYSLSDEQLAERIRADGIDILIDLAGHTGQNRLQVFARKPAPVSVSWLGYGYTTGLTAIDYYLTDETSTPLESDHLFSETPWRLTTPGYVYRPSSGMGEVSSLPAIDNHYVRFGTLTRAVRINHRSIRVWSSILQRVKDARLVIDSASFFDAEMQEAMAKKFEAYGIKRTRLEIAYHSPPWEVLRGIDIGLDCFPHNSGTTLFETLYMGLPYITLAGRPSVGRLGSSILEGVGHPEWIARTEDEYIEKAVALANDVPKLALIRSGLRQDMEASALMDEVGFTGKVEVAYRAMWIKWCEQGRSL